MSAIPSLDDLDLSEYDFIDFGAGAGNSIRHCQKLFGGQGIGIDMNAKKVESSRALGYPVVWGDATNFVHKEGVRFVSMCDFLEHLPDFNSAHRAINSAARSAREFIYIRHPSFEDEAYLRMLGLKQYWHDWTGHPSHLLLCDLIEMLAEAGATPIHVEYVEPTWTSAHPSVLPLDAPSDQHAYEEDVHGPKPYVAFAKPIHRQLKITAYLSYSDEYVLNRLQLCQELLEERKQLIDRMQARRSLRFANYLGQVRRKLEARVRPH